MDEEKKFQEENPKKRTSSGYKAKKASDKLKNETSARKAMRNKLRHGRKDNELTLEEKKKIKKLQVQGRHKIRRDMTCNRAIHSSVDDANEDENVGTEALNKGLETAENTAGAVENRLYSKKIQKHMKEGGPDVDTDSSAFSGPGGKLGSNARTANAKAGSSNYGAGKQAKKAQKSLMKKEFQKAAAKQSEKAAANEIGSFSKKFVDKAEDLMGRFGEWLAERIADHPMIIVAVLILFIIVMLLCGSSTITGTLIGSLSDSTVATSYTADDADILAVEQDYKDKEAALKQKIDNTPTEYPGYDEYRYDLAEINHNPYQLAALLTVLYEDYTEAEVQEKLQEIYDAQYKLTRQEIVEIRTRTVTDPETGEESEEEYEWHVLKTTLKNMTMDAVVRGMGLSDDEMERYELLLETRGNKPYLFGDDVYSNPDPGEYPDYDIPPEALTDTRFANMVREAEKYLGYPYVWGGSSPSTSFDCSGFVSYVINHCGNGWNVGRQTANGLLTNCCTRVSKNDAKPGDLIFFKGTYDTPGASHVGIYVGNGMMCHCGNPIQYSSINTNYWKQHFYTFGRIR